MILTLTFFCINSRREQSGFVTLIIMSSSTRKSHAEEYGSNHQEADKFECNESNKLHCKI